ncbi:MAG: hypothetical protein AB7V77_04330 [Candidatus Woesearchaeota archaeon]
MGFLSNLFGGPKTKEDKYVDLFNKKIEDITEYMVDNDSKAEKSLRFLKSRKKIHKEYEIELQQIINIVKNSKFEDSSNNKTYEQILEEEYRSNVEKIAHELGTLCEYNIAINRHEEDFLHSEHLKSKLAQKLFEQIYSLKIQFYQILKQKLHIDDIGIQFMVNSCEHFKKLFEIIYWEKIAFYKLIAIYSSYEKHLKESADYEEELSEELKNYLHKGIKNFDSIGDYLLKEEELKKKPLVIPKNNAWSNLPKAEDIK